MPVRHDTHGLQAKLVTGVQGAGKVKFLCDQDRLLCAKDGGCPVAAIVGAPAGIVQHKVLAGHAAGLGIGSHGRRLVIVGEPIVAGQEQLVDLARLVQGDGRLHPIGQGIAQAATGQVACAKDDGRGTRRCLDHLVVDLPCGLPPHPQPQSQGSEQDKHAEQRNGCDHAPSHAAAPAPSFSAWR